MATHRIPILGFGTLPDSSGNLWGEPLSVSFGANNLHPRLLFVFKNAGTVKIKLHSGFVVPKNYVGNAKFIVRWSATVTTGNVRWVCDYESHTTGATADPAAETETVGATAAAPGTARFENETSITLTAGNFAVDNTVDFSIARDMTAGQGDSMSGNAYLFAVLFEYTDV